VAAGPPNTCVLALDPRWREQGWGTGIHDDNGVVIPERRTESFGVGQPRVHFPTVMRIAVRASPSPPTPRRPFFDL